MHNLVKMGCFLLRRIDLNIHKSQIYSEPAYQIYWEWSPKPCLIIFLKCPGAEICGLTCHRVYILTWRSDKANGECRCAKIIQFIKILRHGFEGRYLQVIWAKYQPIRTARY